MTKKSFHNKIEEMERFLYERKNNNGKEILRLLQENYELNTA